MKNIILNVYCDLEKEPDFLILDLILDKYI